MRLTEIRVVGAAMLCALKATAVGAAPQTYDCTLTREGRLLTLRFDIDRAAFARPQDPGDPPRRQISRVTTAEAAFEAEAMLSDSGARGFWAPAHGWLLTVARDGRARMSDKETAPWTGHCEETG